jgi:hypothetical protein
MIKVSKKALIITDGTESIHFIANLISDALTGFEVKIRGGENFAGTDLLPVDTFFLGCEKPKPSSFEYLEKMLSHINLASRKCGIFSVKEKSIKYLSGIIKDCEADSGSPLLVVSKDIPKPALKKWVKGVVGK